MIGKTVKRWYGSDRLPLGLELDRAYGHYWHGLTWERVFRYGDRHVWFIMYNHFDRYRSCMNYVRLEEWFALPLTAREELVMQFVQKVTAGPKVGGVAMSASDPTWQKEFPALWEYLTAATWPDGSVRQTATLTLFLGVQGLGGTLNDRQHARSLFAAGRTIRDVLTGLELQAKDPEAVWRHDRNQTGSSKRVKKGEGT